VKVTLVRKVRLIRDGKHQTVRIPRDFELPGKEAVLSKEGNRLILKPAPRPSLLDVLSTLPPLHGDLPESKDRPPLPVEI
jgi:antitoxin VapB